MHNLLYPNRKDHLLFLIKEATKTETEQKKSYKRQKQNVGHAQALRSVNDIMSFLHK